GTERARNRATGGDADAPGCRGAAGPRIHVARGGVEDDSLRADPSAEVDVLVRVHAHVTTLGGEPGTIVVHGGALGDRVERHRHVGEGRAAPGGDRAVARGDRDVRLGECRDGGASDVEVVARVDHDVAAAAGLVE